MTPLSLIEKGILEGDWVSVCTAFNKLTGKKLEPPNLKPPEKKFDPATATKAQLYKKIKEINGTLAPSKAYSLDELREMWTIYSMEEEEEEEENDDVQLNVLDGFRFVSKPDKLLYDDKKSVKIVPDKAIEQIVENPNFKRKEQTSRPAKVKAKCSKCRALFNTYKSYAVEIDGEPTGICDVCKETKP